MDEQQRSTTKVTAAAAAAATDRLRREKTEWYDGEVVLLEDTDNSPSSLPHNHESGEQEEEDEEMVLQKGEENEAANRSRANEAAAEAIAREFQLDVELKCGRVLTFRLTPSVDVKNLKWRISGETDVAPRRQRLFYEGIELDDPDHKLGSYDIRFENGTVYRIAMQEVYSGIIQTYFLNEYFFNHKWTCSYEHIAKDYQTHFRAGQLYVRPLRCIRYGINVLGKYPDGDDWLGVKGMPSSDKEWPVAYHGTKELNVLDILRDGLRLDKCVRCAYGKGIYCSPDPQVALGYGMHYHFDAPDGTRSYYKLILQCRVDPAKLQIVAKGIQYWLVPDGTAIRPYGVCAFLQPGPPLGTWVTPPASMPPTAAKK